MQTQNRNKKIAYLLTPIALAVSHVFVVAAYAQDAVLPDVEVVATTPLPGLNQSIREIPAAVQTINAKKVKDQYATNLSELLNDNLSGVHINEIQGNPYQVDVNYRGFTASPLLGTPQGLSVYVDGIRMNQPFGDVVSWDLIPKSAIRDISLMPGSNPLFGLNTLGGAISVQTKDGISNPGTAVEISGGSFGRRNFQLETGGRNDKGLHWFLTSNLFKEDGWRDSSPSDAKQLFSKIGYVDSNTDLALTLATANNQLTGNGLQDFRLLQTSYKSVYTKPDETNNKSFLANLVGKRDLGNGIQVSGNAYYRKINTSTYNGDLNEGAFDQSVYQPSTTDRAALLAAGYSGYPSSGATYANTPFPMWRCIAQGLLGDEPGEKCTGAINRTSTKQDNYGISGQLAFENIFLGHKNKFIAGAGYDGSAVKFTQSKQWGYVNADHSIIGVSYLSGTTLVPAMADGVNGGDVDGVKADDRVDLKAKTNTWSLFVTDTLSIGDLWHITGSLRYNHTQIKNRDQIVTTGPDSLSGDHTYSRVNPALGVTFTPNKQMSAYVAYSEGSRAPTAIELGCANPDNPCRLPNSMAGDPPLKQVVAKTWESGVRVKATPNFRWNAGLFRTDNHDDIMFLAALSSTTYGYFDNVSKTRRQGGDIGFEAKVDRLTLSAGYTYLNATFQNDMEVNGSANSTNSNGRGLEGEIDVKKGDRIPNIPNHIFKIRADYQLTPVWITGLGIVGISSSYARGNENNLHEAGGTTLNGTTQAYLGSGKSPGYAIFNLNTRYDVTEQLRLFAQVSNLFDKRYSTAGQLGAAGFDANGNIANIRGYGGNATTGYSLQQTTFYAPGAPRALWIGMKYTFDKPARNN